MEDTLLDYLNTTKPDGFVAGPRYVRENDSLLVFGAEEECYGRRIDEFVTVYLSLKTSKPVGFEVKGVSRHMRAAEELNVTGSLGKIHYALNVITVAGAARNPANVSYFRGIGEMAETFIPRNSDALLTVG